MALPRNIIALAEKNQALLDMLGFTPGKDDPYMLCNEEAYRQSGLFSEAAIANMFSASEIPQVTRDNSVIARNIGMVLVRPDMVHITNEIEQFIGERFSILESQGVNINSSTYWRLYQHDFYRRETMHCRLTRAALYIGSQCRLIVFQSTDQQQDIPTADYTRGPLKGSQGVFEPGTLRGDIVFREALRLGLHRLDEATSSEHLRLACDPFTAYRKLAAESNHPSKRLAYPLLFFTAVGVHIPDYTEIGNDLGAFVDITESPYATSS
jgi:hypothetical protein